MGVRGGGGGGAEGGGHDFCFAEEEAVGGMGLVGGGGVGCGCVLGVGGVLLLEDEGRGEGIPAIAKLRAHVFEIGVAHVVDGEDVDVRVFGDAFLDVGVEFQG